MGGRADQPLRFLVQADDPRGRADTLIVHLLRQAGRPTARAEVQRWLAEGRVLVDGAPPRRSRPVGVGARVVVHPAAPLATTATPDPTVPFRVVYEDDDLVVVDKPAGVVVHPARGHRCATLVHGLLAHQIAQGRGSVAPALPADPRDPAGHLRPGIVHRLDKGTSGLLVVARTARARAGLEAQFARHSVDRLYLAIVVGQAARATYDTPYGRHPKSRQRFTSRPRPSTSPLRRAVTHVEPVETLEGATLVRCRLETGRTHQIRVHLAERGRTPVLGDPLYGGRPGSPTVRAIAESLGRQALHASVLGFVHPVSGARLRWESPLPPDLGAALAALRQAVTRPAT